MAALFIRIGLRPGGCIGPGKVALLEAIARVASISGAARTLQMSYRSTWVLVDELDLLFQRCLATSVDTLRAAQPALVAGAEFVARVTTRAQ